MKKIFLLYAIIFFMTAYVATALGNNFDFFLWNDDLMIDSITYGNDGYAYLVMNPYSTFGDSGIDNAMVNRYNIAGESYSRFDKLNPSGSLTLQNVSYAISDDTTYHQKAIFWGSSTRILSGIPSRYPYSSSYYEKCSIYKFDNINEYWIEKYSYNPITCDAGYSNYNPVSMDCRKKQYYDTSSTMLPYNNIVSFYSMPVCMDIGFGCSYAYGCGALTATQHLSSLNISTFSFINDQSLDETVYKSINPSSSSKVFTDSLALYNNGSFISTNPDL